MRGVRGDRGEVDDPAGAARDHLLGHRADQLDRRFQVDAQDALALFLGVVVDGNRVLHAGVVDQDVDLAERIDQLRNAGEVGKVVLDLAFEVQAQDAESRFRQGVGGGAADAARGAGDQRGFHASPGMVKPAALSSLISSFS